jgi:hypothetical protein
MRPLLALLWLVVIIADGATASQPMFDVLTLADSVGIRRPYVHTRAFAVAPQHTLAALLGSLERRGAQILAVDSRTGLVSWCDTGLTFVALPTHLRQQPRPPTSWPGPRLGVWHGVVHGTARLRPFDKGTWLSLHIRGREGTAESVVLSDGSYERDIFTDLTRHLNPADLAAPGSERRGGLRVQTAPETNRPTQAAIRACFPRLGDLSQLGVSQIQAQGLPMVYPAPLDMLWEACLDVIAQYSAIVKASLNEKLIVFTQGIALPSESAGTRPRQINVLLALYAASRGSDGSTVYVAHLAPQGLSIKPVHDLKKANKEALAGLKTRPEELAAALIVDRLFAHLTTQLFYAERWGDKFTRRHAVQGRP